jgi:Tfp pilus assembly protein PilN
MININRKLEEIRQQPEHIRMRYVWGAVAVSMFLIILIWIFSFKSTFNSASSDKVTLPDLKSAYESSKQELPSIQSFIDKNTTATGNTEGAVNNSDNSTNSIPGQ